MFQMKKDTKKLDIEDNLSKKIIFDFKEIEKEKNFVLDEFNNRLTYNSNVSSDVISIANAKLLKCEEDIKEV